MRHTEKTSKTEKQKQLTTIKIMENEIIETTLYKGKVKARFLGPTEEMPNRHIYQIDGERKKSVTGIIGIKDKSMALVPWALEEAAKFLFAVLDGKKEINQKVIVAAVFASQESKERAADLGTKVHDWIERYIKYKLGQKGYEKLPEMPEDSNVITGVTSFINWESEHKVKYLWTEKLLYSKKLNYMGKADFAAVIDGKKCLCDLKASNGLYKEVRMQTAAYRNADEEEEGLPYAGRWAIRISKETLEEYLQRMSLKASTKALLGKKAPDTKDYMVFEAKYLDEDKGAYKEDIEAFKACLTLSKWDSKAKI